MTLGERIRFFRKRTNLTQAELATKLDIKEEELMHWEYNDATPDLAQILTLSKALGISVEELTDEVELPPSAVVAPTPSTPQPRKNKDKNRKTLLGSIAALIAAAIIATLLFTNVIPLGRQAFSQSPEAIADAENSVVMIYCYDDEENEVATGSGVILFDDSTVVTNYHVIETAMQVKLSTQQDFTFEVAEILAYDIDRDIAILKTSEPTGLTPLPLGDSAAVMKGEAVTAIGSPLGIKNTVSTGVLSGRTHNGIFDELQFTAPISSGSSGGALFNESGEIIGITYASFIEGQNLNLAIPSEVVQDVYDQRSESITMEGCLKENQPGIYMFYKSEYVDCEKLLANSMSYDGKIITTIAYIESISPSPINKSFGFTFAVNPDTIPTKELTQDEQNALYEASLGPYEYVEPQWLQTYENYYAAIDLGNFQPLYDGSYVESGKYYLLCGVYSGSIYSPENMHFVNLETYYIEEIPQ